MERKASARAAQGSGTIRKKTVTRSGKEYTYWEARVTVGKDPGTGKQKQRSFSGKTQKEVREKMQAAAVELNNGTYKEQSKMTTGEWLDIWQADYLGNTKPHTRKSYAGVIKNHIKPAIGAIKLSALTPVHVQKLVNGLAPLRKVDASGTVNPKTVKNVHGILHSALQQAMLCGYIASNPADRAILPKRTKAEIKVLDTQQVPAFLKAIDKHPFENLYRVDLFTGMRQSELLGLQWGDVDFGSKTVLVKRQLQYLGHAHGGYRYSTPKNNKPRLIVLPDRAVSALQAQKIRQLEMRLAAGACWDNPDDLVFTDELGQHLKHDLIYRHLKRIFSTMGVPDMRFHDLRHSYAVLSLQSGCDIKTVQENLGHYAAAFTLDTYAHVTEQMRREGADKMNRLLEALEVG